MSKSGKFAFGALVAGAAGYVAGVLTAPKSGKETRKDIKQAATQSVNEAERQLKRLHTDLQLHIADVANLVDSSKGKAKTEIESALQIARKVKEKARVVLSSAHEGETDDKDLQRAIDEASKAIENLRKFANK